MYYRDITDPEIQVFHGLKIQNFTITLSDVLTSDLFKVDTIITDKIYKIYPLFYTGEITSTNGNDQILDNQCVICLKNPDKETYLTFISNPDEPITDYSNYATYKDISDSLTTAEYNGLISLLRRSQTHNDKLRIKESVTGEYGEYLFDIDDVTFLDTGILITDETITAEPKVKLTNNFFKHSTYTLILNVIHYTGVNILDDVTPSDYKVVDTLEIELTPEEWVDIPVTDLEEGYIISFDCKVNITHDKTIIQGVQTLELTTDKNIIQTNEISDLTATAYNFDEEPEQGATIYFYKITGA